MNRLFNREPEPSPRPKIETPPAPTIETKLVNERLEALDKGLDRLQQIEAQVKLTMRSK